MRWTKLLRAVWLLPFALAAGKANLQKNPEEAYGAAQIWARRVLKWMGYRIETTFDPDCTSFQGTFLISNHQGSLDPLIIVATCPEPVRFISKKENESLPLIGLWARSIRTIHFDRKTRKGNISMLRTVLKAFAQQQTILLFPEGTRSRSDQMNPFREHSLECARQARVPILPITLNYAYDFDGASVCHPVLKIHYGSPLLYEQYKEWSEEMLRFYMEEEIARFLEPDSSSPLSVSQN